MRKIQYIFIDSDDQANGRQSGVSPLSFLRYHFTVDSKGLVIPGTDIRQSVRLIQGPSYEPDKYNRCSIVIRYDGSLRPEVWLLHPEISCQSVQQQRKALLELLAELRKHFPEAQILGTQELDGKALNARNIIVNDAMNVLRKELSDYP